MLKFLTLKFRNQSINEVKPYEPQLFLQGEYDLEDLERNEDEDDEELKEINGATVDNPFNNNNNVRATLKFDPSVTLVASKENIIQRKETNADNGRGFLPIESASDFKLGCPPEKRKWSEVNAHKLLQQLTSGSDSSSSDDEVKEICSHKTGPLAFSSSPPGKVTVLPKHSAFSTRVRPSYANEGHSRKKHRVVFAEDISITRPSLNLEKMQQKSLLKKHGHGVSRPRPWRIRSVSAPRHSRSCDPTVLSFKPIQVNTTLSLAPVEEPGFAY